MFELRNRTAESDQSEHSGGLKTTYDFLYSADRLTLVLLMLWTQMCGSKTWLKFELNQIEMNVSHVTGKHQHSQSETGFLSSRPGQLWDGESLERADHLRDAEQSAARHVLLFVCRFDDLHRLQQHGDKRLLVVRAKAATEQFEAVECRLSVDGLLCLLCDLTVTFTHDAQQVAGQLQEHGDLGQRWENDEELQYSFY